MSLHRSVLLIAILILLSSGLTSYAAEPPAVAVVYPELQEPYRSVVDSIIEGIQEKIKEPVQLIPLGKDFNTEQLKGAIDRGHFAAIVALGRTGLMAAKPWQGKMPIVVGALLLNPDKKEPGISGISLVADPNVFLNYLEQMAPAVKRVHVVYSPRVSEWLIRIARSSASERNIQLISYKSKDIRSSALIYRDILNKSQPGKDAIWLLPDPVAVDDKLILPLLLRGAWDQNILVYSSNPTHVRRGALFALFPDNKGMGESLAKMTDSYLKGKNGVTAGSIIPLSDLQSAINVRTAEHIGLFISDEQRQKFSLIFPSP